MFASGPDEVWTDCRGAGPGGLAQCSAHWECARGEGCVANHRERYCRVGTDDCAGTPLPSCNSWAGLVLDGVQYGYCGQ